MRRAMHRLEEEAELRLEHRDQPLGNRAVERTRIRNVGIDPLAKSFRERAENLLLALEAQIDSALGDFGFAGDIVDRSAPVAILAEQADRRIEDSDALGSRRASSLSAHSRIFYANAFTPAIAVAAAAGPPSPRYSGQSVASPRTAPLAPHRRPMPGPGCPTLPFDRGPRAEAGRRAECRPCSRASSRYHEQYHA